MSSSAGRGRGRGGGGRGRGGSRGSRGRGGGPPARVADLPHGTCRSFWTTGSCNHGFQCRFQHIAKTGVVEPSSGNVEDDDTNIDFFSMDNLVTVTVGEQSMRPGQVHNHLRDFLKQDHSRFSQSALRQESFVSLFGSIRPGNKSWSTEQAQDFLITIVNDGTLQFMGLVLRSGSVSTAPSSSSLSFQRAYFPLLHFFVSDFLLKSTMHQNVNKLYTLIDQNYADIHSTLMACIPAMIQAGTWKDSLARPGQADLSGPLLFTVLQTLLDHYIQTFKKTAFRDHSSLLQLIQNLYTWFHTWLSAINSKPPTFDDPFTRMESKKRALHLRHLEDKLLRLRSIAHRECGVVDELRVNPTIKTSARRHEDFLFMLEQVHEPPGELRPGGPRHDNDCVNIADIRSAPTHEELLTPLEPYLPVFVHGSPHHLTVGSMEKHVDIQHRLLREDMLSEPRKAVRAIEIDLEAMLKPRNTRPPTILEGLLSKRGGAYRTNGHDGVFFHLYTNPSFASASAQRRNFAVGLTVDPPPSGNARHPKAKERAEYWEHARRLSNGNLVVLVLQNHTNELCVFVGTVSSSSTDIAESSKADPDRIELRVTFFEPELELDSLRGEQISPVRGSKYKFGVLVDTNVLFESVRPFLRTLQSVEPTSIPFGRYIAAESMFEGRGKTVEPPEYARVPGFRFKIGSLFESGVGGMNELNVESSQSVKMARDALREKSRLDPSQADAVVDALTREISLIQGPPGTGKSFTGKEILRVLFESKIKPIVLISFTNHALDHMLLSILDDNITNKIVRLGSRSSDERIAQFNLIELQKMKGNGSMDQTLKRAWGRMKGIEEEMERIINDIQLPFIHWSQVEAHLRIHYPEACEAMLEPPAWISRLHKEMQALLETAEDNQWVTVGKKGKKDSWSVPKTIYGFWRKGLDLEFLEARGPFVAKLAAEEQQAREDVAQENGIDIAYLEQKAVDPRLAWLSYSGLESVPMLPDRWQARNQETLLDSRDLWNMILPERTKLAHAWEDEVRRHAYDSNLEDFTNARARFDAACEEYNNIQDQANKELLSRTDLIGCTTTGAAKLVSLLTAVAPKVLMVEEAGQILEAHTLAALVRSVQHMICIGDPQQLRPTLATFSLSVDSARGRRLYQFDRSLMERLSSNGFPMSLINVQRRMRPEISRFPRLILYPNLEDNNAVLNYPCVQGMQENVYFLTHTHGESGEKDSVSKYNAYEVQWICHLVKYFLKQGCYSSKGDVAVLCAYLGQLQQVRLALRKEKLAVTVGERDQEQLVRQGIEDPDEDSFQDVEIARHIRLGTVDTFQGEEAKIVIISLVRNSGDFASDSSIGFLKVRSVLSIQRSLAHVCFRIINRVNVALSRAKHGMYILGNASNLRQNETWSRILDELEMHGQIGPALPIACHRHPDAKHGITNPKDLSENAPLGGCLVRCGLALECGHICKALCHPDPNQHKRMFCDEPCPRITCPRSHPCDRRCGENCGQCLFPLYNVRLPCGHILEKLECHQMDQLSDVPCHVKVAKKLTGCEHTQEVYCSQDVATVRCTAACGEPRTCCSKTCQSPCHECRQLTTEGSPESKIAVKRTVHQPHSCERMLFCQHLCGRPCHSNKDCNDSCAQACHQSCDHQACAKPCSNPCAPCAEPCTWNCSHHQCPVPCGSSCARLPCDEPCKTILSCTHPCPSVCGEPCSQQTCSHCALKDNNESSPQHAVVDMIMNRTLAELQLDSEDVTERTITLTCGHVFTVETLDGVCHMSDFYEVDPMTGSYPSMKAPPTDYTNPPVCPTCRASITSPRYGRVVKRARLDILERNVAGSLSKSLSQIERTLETIEAEMSSMSERAAALPKVQTIITPEAFGSLVETRTNKVYKPGHAAGPISPKFLCSSSVPGEVNHGFTEDGNKEWKVLVKELVRQYRRLVDLIKRRSPHATTYEASLSTLYRQEFQKLLDGTNDKAFEGKPEEFAMREADRRIGQPPHKADTRFQVDAYLLSITLRLYLVQLSRVHYNALAKDLPSPEDPTSVTSVEIWASFMQFLLESCQKDAATARAMAEKSAAWRQMTRCDISALRISMECFKLSIASKRYEICRNGLFQPSDRQTLVDEITAEEARARLALSSTEEMYTRKMPSKTMADMRAARLWFNEHCKNVGEKILKEYIDFGEFIGKDKVYQPLSAREKDEIVKAFDFGYRGHWFNCENGHPFVIGECGGAMQASRCPECGAPIGGADHRLHVSNTRAMEFEQISQAQGGRDGHWPWQQGA